MSSESTVSVLCPYISEAGMEPNPVSINTKFLLSVSITEIAVVLRPETRYSGEEYSGEE